MSENKMGPYANWYGQCMAARERYENALADLQDAEQNADRALKEADSRIDADRKADAERLAFLKRLLAGSPFYELQKIKDRLAEADAAQGQSTAAWMVSQYHGKGAPAMLHPSDRRRLEDQKRQLERELLHHTPTEDEKEYSELLHREYNMTEDEENELSVQWSTLEAAHDALLEARRNLHELVERLHKKLQPFEDLLRDGSFTTVQNGYERTKAALYRVI